MISWTFVLVIVVVLFIYLLIHDPKMALDIAEAIIIGIFKFLLLLAKGIARLVDRLVRRR